MIFTSSPIQSSLRPQALSSATASNNFCRSSRKKGCAPSRSKRTVPIHTQRDSGCSVNNCKNLSSEKVEDSTCHRTVEVPSCSIQEDATILGPRMNAGPGTYQVKSINEHGKSQSQPLGKTPR